MISPRPEILVIGAGPGGASTAWALARAGREVLLVDQADFPRDKTCGDGLPPLAVHDLRRMGVLEQIEAAGAARIDEVRLIGPFGQIATTRLADLSKQEPLYALVLPRYKLDNILRLHAMDAGVEYAGGIRVEHLEIDKNHITQVIGSSPSGRVELRPRQVVIATGAAMGMLTRDGFIRHKPTLVRAARAYFTHVGTAANRYEFYLDRQLLPGYGWIFPTGDGMANVGIGTMSTWWARHKTPQAELQAFVKRRAWEGSMAEAEPAGPVKGYPLRIDFPSQRIAGDNWVIVGEATGLVNPLTGEGIDLAISSGLLAAEVIDRSISDGTGLITYQHELWERFGPMFSGLRLFRDIMVTPVFADYVIWLMGQHRFFANTILNIVLGYSMPQSVFHPLFILQFLMPISPALAVRETWQAFRTQKKSVQA